MCSILIVNNINDVTIIIEIIILRVMNKHLSFETLFKYLKKVLITTSKFRIQ